MTLRIYLTEQPIKELETRYAVTDDHHRVLAPVFDERVNKVLIRVPLIGQPDNRVSYTDRQVPQKEEQFSIGDFIHAGRAAKNEMETMLMGCPREEEVKPNLARILQVGSLTEYSPLFRQLQDQLQEYKGREQEAKDAAATSRAPVARRYEEAKRQYEAALARIQESLTSKLKPIEDERRKFLQEDFEAVLRDPRKP